MPDGASATIGGIFTRVKVNIDKKGKRMAFATLEDFAGSIEVIIFSDLFEKKRQIVNPESMVMVSGRISKREDEKPKLIADGIELLDSIAEGGGLVLKLFIDGPGFNGGRLEGVEKILSEYPGSAEVVLVLNTGSERVSINTSKLRTSAKPGLTRKLSELLGTGKVKWEVSATNATNGTNRR
jgi:DNA polymerase-3 subunit alpha